MLWLSPSVSFDENCTSGAEGSQTLHIECFCCLRMFHSTKIILLAPRALRHYEQSALGVSERFVRRKSYFWRRGRSDTSVTHFFVTHKHVFRDCVCRCFRARSLRLCVSLDRRRTKCDSRNATNPRLQATQQNPAKPIRKTANSTIENSLKLIKQYKHGLITS